MSKKPIIGINADFRPSKNDSIPLSWINTGYYDSVTGAGGIPMIIPPLAEDDDLRPLLDKLDGLVLTGCKLDLEPVRLGFDPHPATRAMPSRREDFRPPTGETRLQHEDSHTGRRFRHADPQRDLRWHALSARDRRCAEGVAASRHCRRLPAARDRDRPRHPKMDDIYGPGEIRVNSDHHMAIDQVAPCFRVSATSMDGVVEAYESMDEAWWCLGTQFHPENQSASALDMQVFETFIDGVKEQAIPEIYSFEQQRHAA